MIFITFPGMVAVLPIVILVEGLVYRNSLNVKPSRAFSASASSNLLSTLIGVPVAWAIMLAVELTLYPIDYVARHFDWKLTSPVAEAVTFILSMAWLPPMGKGHKWLIPIAASLLLVPSFFVSVWIERRICSSLWKGEEADRVRKAVVRANVMSYCMLFVIGVCWLMISRKAGR